MSDTHVNKEYTVFQVAINLILACVCSGVIIGVVYFFTHHIAVEKTEMIKQQSMKELVKEAETFKEVPNKTEWFAAEKAGKVIAYVVPGETKGYGGPIKMQVAVTTDGKVIDYNIMSSNETPGLGDNASKEPFRSQLKDKKVEHLVVVKDPSNKDDIQAMTGATISSKAVTKAVKEAVESVTAFAGGK